MGREVVNPSRVEGVTIWRRALRVWSHLWWSRSSARWSSQRSRRWKKSHEEVIWRMNRPKLWKKLPRMPNLSPQFSQASPPQRAKSGLSQSFASKRIVRRALCEWILVKVKRLKKFKVLNQCLTSRWIFKDKPQCSLIKNWKFNCWIAIWISNIPSSLLRRHIPQALRMLRLQWPRVKQLTCSRKLESSQSLSRSVIRK